MYLTPLDARPDLLVNFNRFQRTVFNLKILKVMSKTVANSEVKVANKKSSRKAKAEPQVEVQVQEVAVVESENSEEVSKKKLICVKPSFGRWYVYFRGVKPEDNVGCGCKTAKSAIRYMMFLKKNHDAEIFNKDYQMLKAEAAKEA